MMKQAFTGLIAVTALAGVLSAPAAAEDEVISYYLTKTELSVALQLTLKKCATRDDDGKVLPPQIGADWVVKAAGAADQNGLVQVDVSNGFLAKRSSAFTFNGNGTLAAFNSEAEGQGGAVLEAVVKLAGVAAGWSGFGPGAAANVAPDTQPPIPKGRFACTAAISGSLEKLNKFREKIAMLEERVFQGDATAAQVNQLDQLRGERARVVKSLTVTLPAKVASQAQNATLRTVLSESKLAYTLEVDTTPIVAKWFEAVDEAQNTAAIGFDIATVDGINGYDIAILPAGPLPDGRAALQPNGPERRLYFRRPVLASVTVADRGCAVEPTDDCTEKLALDAPLLIGQWGRIEALKIGTGGLFGSREAKAKFDQFGTPLELSFGSDSGAASMASAVGAAGDAATAIVDADIVALEKAIKRAELRKKLDELNDE